MTIHWKAVEQYFTVMLSVFFPFVILKNLSLLDLALSAVKGLNRRSETSDNAPLTGPPHNS